MEHTIRAKKHLGQHFLHSKSALIKIHNAAHITKDDIVIEVGPGTGALTELLLADAGKVIAIEKDRDLIPLLQEKFSAHISDGTLELLEADILTFDPAARQDLKKGYKLVANIPYYITGAIIEQFLSSTCQPSLMVLLIQKEVAERILARDPAKSGTSAKESIYSIAVKAYGIPHIVGKVLPGSFTPPPTVDSAILSIEGITRDFFADCDETLFFNVMKALFGKKRKQIGGSLAEFLGNKEQALAALTQAGIDAKTRPEDIHLQTWKKLTQALET